MNPPTFPLRLHRINVSQGGVPKRAIREAQVTATGLAEDRQANTEHHGGPERALCLLGLDVIERLQAEGHPIEPGSTGDNLTLAGLCWADVAPGDRFEFEGGVALEAASYARPCSKIRASFADARIQRFDGDLHPENARIYARVLVPGRLRQGEAARHLRAAERPR